MRYLYLCFIVLISMLAFSNPANAIETDLAQFQDYQKDFATQKFSFPEALLFDFFLKAHCNSLNQYAKNPSSPLLQFLDECTGAETVVNDLNHEHFDWRHMWDSKNNADRARMYMLNEDLTVMKAELNGAE